MAIVLLISKMSGLIATHQLLLLIKQANWGGVYNFGDLSAKRLRQAPNFSDVTGSNPGCGVLMRSQKI